MEEVNFRNFIWAVPREAFNEGFDIEKLNGVSLGCPERYELIFNEQNIKKGFIRTREGKLDSSWTMKQFIVQGDNNNLAGKDAVVITMVPGYHRGSSDTVILHIGGYQFLNRKFGSASKLSWAEFDFFE